MAELGLRTTSEPDDADAPRCRMQPQRGEHGAGVTDVQALREPARHPGLGDVALELQLHVPPGTVHVRASAAAHPARSALAIPCGT